MTLERLQPCNWNSRAHIQNGYICMSGIVPDDKRLGMKKQTEEVLTKIDGILDQAGYDQTKILSALVYISDMDQKNAMNESSMEWMGSNNSPATACVGVILTPDPPVEIMIHAA